MSSASPSHVLVNHSYATDEHLPSKGEIILVRLSENLFGPGSIIENSRNLPSRSTQFNYHNAVVLDINLHVFEALVNFTVCPMPAYSSTDPESGLSSTSWLLDQPDDFQQLHIPVPYEASTLTQPNPPFPTPVRFGDPLFIGGWKDRRPSWVQAVTQVADLKYTTTFKCYEPPAKLSADEVRRLEEYCGLFPSPVFSSSSTMSPFPPGDGDSAAAGPEVSPPGGGAVMGTGLFPGQPGGSNHHDGAGLPASRSLAFQALYANDAVKRAFADSERRSMTLDLCSDDSGDDDDEVWEDNMDPIAFARYYAASNPHLAKIVQEHDQKMRERLDQGIVNWIEGVQSETF